MMQPGSEAVFEGQVIHTHICVDVSTYIRTYTYACLVYAYMCLHIYVQPLHVHVYVYVDVNLYANVLCICT